ncbi:MAG: acyl--CoA ligase [Clostridia bacterium]|nr:acyl--CoA ligase [Clostridia bacterium]MBR0157681.1 acyl--CoA ligase [Clostridia bacterium]
MTIIDLLEQNAKNAGGEVALVEFNPNLRSRKEDWKEFSLNEGGTDAKLRKELTWGEFDSKANRVANYLLSRGVKKGDKVAILLMNCLEWLPIYFGVLKTGALAVPMNYRYTAEEIRYCLDLSDASYLIFGQEFVSRIEEILEEIKGVKLMYCASGLHDTIPEFSADLLEMLDYASSAKPKISYGLTEDDYAAIYFSSGTTGFPKAILHKHRSLINSCRTEQAHHGQTRDDVFICIPPLYHTGAKMHWFGSLLSCSRAVLLRGVTPEWIIRTAALEHATIVWLLVPWAQDILDAIDRGDIDLGEYDLSAWRLMHIGAQPVPPSLIRRWKEHFPNHEYDTNYGLSESIGPGCVHLGVENIDHVGAIGKAGYLWETRICDEKGNDVVPGDVGELWVKGPGVMTCYYKNPEATAEVLHGDWLATGDMAREDEQGFIYLVDRKKDVIITGGENLYPVQIEDYLREHPAIKDVAVIGLPDKRLGEIAAAIIEVKPGMTLSEDEVNEFCQNMPRYKRPRKIIFATVPRNPTGKIEKPLLRERYCGERLVEAQTTS